MLEYMPKQIETISASAKLGLGAEAGEIVKKAAARGKLNLDRQKGRHKVFLMKNFNLSA